MGYSNIVIGLIPTGQVVSAVCSVCWLVVSNVAIIVRNVLTGHVVSVVCSVSWMLGSNIVIGLYIPDMWTWSVFCVPYLGCWVLI